MSNFDEMPAGRELDALDFGITEYTVDNFCELVLNKRHGSRASSQSGCLVFFKGDEILLETCSEAIWWLYDYFSWRWKLDVKHPENVSFEQYQKWRLENMAYDSYNFFFETPPIGD
jgi:hypothetical protein